MSFCACLCRSVRVCLCLPVCRRVVTQVGERRQVPQIRRPLRCRRVRIMPDTPNTTNTHKSLFYEILQQPDTTITTDTTGSLILPLPPILPVVI